MNEFGKHFRKMYTGSMKGAGTAVFAVWGYCIGTAEPPGLVELFPKSVAMDLGGTEDEVSRAIEFLCSPDPNSRTADGDGRRLERVDGHLYRMVNWCKYRDLNGDEEKREYWRQKKAESRKRLELNGQPVPPPEPPSVEKPPRKPTSGAHAEFIAMWCEKYEASLGRKYVVAGGKDGAAASRLLASSGLTPEALVAIAGRAWANLNGFNCKQAASLSGFAGKFNEIQVELDRRPPSKELRGGTMAKPGENF